jgi:hypothetical protein
MPSPTALTVVAGAAALAALACGGERERPAGWPASGAAPASSSSDPWAAPAANAPAAAAGGLGGLGDPVEMLRTVVENLGRPGPYEAQAASADHAADRRVRRVHGGLHREARVPMDYRLGAVRS